MPTKEIVIVTGIGLTEFVLTRAIRQVHGGDKVGLAFLFPIVVLMLISALMLPRFLTVRRWMWGTIAILAGSLGATLGGGLSFADIFLSLQYWATLGLLVYAVPSFLAYALVLVFGNRT